MKSIFIDKAVKPLEQDLKAGLGDTYELWQELATFTKEKYPQATEEWNYSGAKFGWSFRIKDKKRVLIYLLPRRAFFKTAFVFGQKATAEILISDISRSIKEELKEAKVYAEGRGIRLEVKGTDIMPDLRKLIEIKVKS